MQDKCSNSEFLTKEVFRPFKDATTSEEKQGPENLVSVPVKLVYRQSYVERADIKKGTAYLTIICKVYVRENIWVRAIGLISRCESVGKRRESRGKEKRYIYRCRCRIGY